MIAEELPDDWHDLELYLPSRHILSSTSPPPLPLPLNRRLIEAQPHPYPLDARALVSSNSEFSPNFPSLSSMSLIANSSASAPVPPFSVYDAGPSAAASASASVSVSVSPLQALLVAALLLVIAGTAVGNFLVALSLLAVRRLRSQPANLLLLSLSISDQLIALTVEPFALYKTFFAPYGWELGPFTCKVCTLHLQTFDCVLVYAIRVINLLCTLTTSTLYS